MPRRTYAKVLSPIAMILLSASMAWAYPSLFTNYCVSCHADDTPTCNGCHMHRGSLSANPDQGSYLPGEDVGITFNGGSQYGWIRARLYDQNDIIVDLATGPSGTGDDGLGGAVTFPVQLQAPAPTEPGTYVWEAAWYGNNNGGGHIERRTPVTIVVESGGTGIPDMDWENASWQSIKALY